MSTKNSMFFYSTSGKFDTGKMKITSDRCKFGHRSPTGGVQPHTRNQDQGKTSAGELVPEYPPNPMKKKDLRRPGIQLFRLLKAGKNICKTYKST